MAAAAEVRPGTLRACAEAPEHVFLRYERHKREYKQTASSCEAAGFGFIPLIFEALGGGFSSTARGVLSWVARQAAAAHNSEPGTESLRVAQRISCTLHRENARAILRRSQPPAAEETQPSGWDASAADEQWQ